VVGALNRESREAAQNRDLLKRIASETGGGYYGNNSGMQAVVTLPNSGFQVRVPMYEYWNAVPGYDGTRRGTRPDDPVETTTSGLLAGEDEQLNRALKLAGRLSK